jgi:hypothetical protein
MMSKDMCVKRLEDAARAQIPLLFQIYADARYLYSFVPRPVQPETGKHSRLNHYPHYPCLVATAAAFFWDSSIRPSSN